MSYITIFPCLKDLLHVHFTIDAAIKKKQKKTLYSSLYSKHCTFWEYNGRSVILMWIATRTHPMHDTIFKMHCISFKCNSKIVEFLKGFFLPLLEYSITATAEYFYTFAAFAFTTNRYIFFTQTSN